ncbi:hypothetical protein ADT71_19020 [Novosphingobium sp. ST904]|nr:hypothetical protein ADT71_19020 [Novosphingobium sp. ST904]
MSTNRPQDTLAGLQVARALAALAVTVHHALEMSNGVAGSFSPDWLTTGGAGGVDVFFVISGFIMAHTSFQTGKAIPSPLDFLQRRATRIYPLYWLVCLAMLSLMAMGFFQKQFLTGGDIAMALALLPGGRRSSAWPGRLSMKSISTWSSPPACPCVPAGWRCSERAASSWCSGAWGMPCRSVRCERS